MHDERGHSNFFCGGFSLALDFVADGFSAAPISLNRVMKMEPKVDGAPEEGGLGTSINRA